MNKDATSNLNFSNLNFAEQQMRASAISAVGYCEGSIGRSPYQENRREYV